MKHFFLFFFILFVFYSLFHFYLMIRVKQFFNAQKLPLFVKLLWIFLALSYPLGQLLKSVVFYLGFPLFLIGSLYLGFMAYFFLITLLLEITFFVLKIFKKNSFLLKKTLAKIGYSLCVLIFIIGWIQFYQHKITTFKVPINASGKNLKIAVLADVHYGSPFITQNYLAKVFQKTQKMNPDLILFAGDLIDSALSEKEQNVLTKELSYLKAPLGVFAVSGNHECYAGYEVFLKTLKQGNVTILEDKGVDLGSVFLVGRKDREIKRMGQERKSLKAILSKNTLKKPVIVIDHQPHNLKEGVKNNIAVQVSGHTHHGQMFPLNFITQNIYEVSKGFLQKENSRFYVSSGAGAWGPPLRFLNPPEIVVLEIEFQN